MSQGLASASLASTAPYVWQSWSPTLEASSTNPTIGNGTTIGRYIQYGSGEGSFVVCHYYFEFGSTSNAGSGAWRVAPPITPIYGSYDAGGVSLGTTALYDTSASRHYSGGIRILTTPYFEFLAETITQITHSSPFSRATGDRFGFTAIYEVGV